MGPTPREWLGAGLLALVLVALLVLLVTAAMPAGAKQANPGDPADGPASGAFVVDGATDDVAAQMQRRLGAAGYSTEALSGPFEDGSLVIDSVGPNPACRVQTRVRPLGGTTMITVLFGAACPWG